jgi:hypothetical protein
MLAGAPKAQEGLSVSGFSDVPKNFLAGIRKYPD